jgi:hypothetical protein
MPGQAFRPNHELLAARVEPKKGKESQPKRLHRTQAPSDGHHTCRSFINTMPLMRSPITGLKINLDRLLAKVLMLTEFG